MNVLSRWPSLTSLGIVEFRVMLLYDAGCRADQARPTPARLDSYDFGCSRHLIYWESLIPAVHHIFSNPKYKCLIIPKTYRPRHDTLFGLRYACRAVRVPTMNWTGVS